MNVSLARRAGVARAKAACLPPSNPRLPSISCQSLYAAPLSIHTTYRSLWWWSRRNDWTMDEDMEDRIMRRQKMMRNRYSNFLRRRSIWEGDEHARSPIWASSRRWLVTRWADKKALSCQRAVQASMQEPGKRSEPERPWKEWDRDFDKLRARIDEEIERDPYGTLFGRHLRGPPSPNNSSWTSFSWIYGPLRSISKSTTNALTGTVAEPSKDSSTASSTSPRRPVFSVPPSTPSATRSSRVIPGEQEYEFDPITMRKVPKSDLAPQDTSTSSTTPEAPKKAFLESLFSEHGVDIPVKTYQPHKVYGYGRGDPPVKKPSAEEGMKPKPKTSGIGLESSRMRDLQALKFRTMGTNIDTTAEYGGKFKNAADPEPIHLTSAQENTPTPEPSENSKGKHDVMDVSGKDTANLFAGTTYESKAQSLAFTAHAMPSTNSSWLMKEGFRTLPEASSRTKSGSTSETGSQLETKPPRIEPALDRVRATDVKSRSKIEGVPRMEQSDPMATTEDIDLLRASDVRAATRSFRVTRHEVEQGKQEARRKLETDYSKRQLTGAAQFAVDVESTKERVSRSLTNVWDHVKNYPQGFVAKTMNSMGLFNENYKSYVRPDKPIQDSTEKLVFKDETLSKTPSIYRKTSKDRPRLLQTFTPSQEVIDVEKAEKARLAFVRKVNEESKKATAVENQKAEQLASEIRNVYEEEYGNIDANHRQPTTIQSVEAKPQITSEMQSAAVVEFRKPQAAVQAIGPATIKPGFKEDPVIKHHVEVFEPKLARIMDQAKAAHRAIHESKLEFRSLKSTMQRAVIEDSPMEAVSTLTPKSETLPLEPALNRKSETQLEGKNKPWEAAFPTPLQYKSEYVILSYDMSTEEVKVSPLDSPISMQESPKTIGVPQILASLNHTAKFLSHFAGLSKQGYEVISGGGDILVFKKRPVKAAEPMKSPLLTHVKAIIDKNKLAAQEASAQPESKLTPEKKAATVLDEIPPTEPTPGPAGPTAPPLGPPSYMRHSVKRQEQVFSASKTSRVSPPPGASTTAKKAREEAARDPATTQLGLWTRFKRGVKRVVLTAVAMGAGAYAIGAVAESLGAQQHHPPGKVIQGRPGIYSTEDSR